MKGDLWNRDEFFEKLEWEGLEGLIEYVEWKKIGDPKLRALFRQLQDAAKAINEEYEEWQEKA